MKNGSAIFFSSVAATKGLSNHELISAAKAGIEGFVRSAAASYAKDNLRVNAIAPVAGVTPLLKSFMGGNTTKKKQALELIIMRFFMLNLRLTNLKLIF